MRRIYGVVILIVTISIIYLLDNKIGDIPALGRFLDPVNGCWASAETVNRDFTAEIRFPELKNDASVWFDDRIVPHVRAENDHDLFYIEGYLHAFFRLWQMDMETRAAAGRVSEIIGNKTLNYDRGQRRKGMVYGAENSLNAIEKDPRTKMMMDAYTEGINHYITSLKFRDFPFEYKLMGFAPEKWTNLKASLLLKYMADDLTGYTEDIPLTYLRDVLPKEQFLLLFPEKITGSSPVIPTGTIFDAATLAIPQVPDGAIFPKFEAENKKISKNNLPVFAEKQDGIGSNNWAVGPGKTQNEAAILCNDPHLMLNLPSLWFEIQLQTPDRNVYGASLPGAPGIIIGFNDSISWGLTNNYRDVKDFYSIKQAETDKNKYWFAGKQLAYEKRIEKISMKGMPDFLDTVNYTIHGPVMYDDHFTAPGNYNKPLAMCWMAHNSTNELLAIYLLNKAKNYNEYVDAILNFQCPAQNMVYADRLGNVAIWGQGQFVNKWKEQGKYIMNGADSTTLWKELIPMRENPHVLNPERGFVSSANQCVTDSSYPYWYNGYFIELRAWRINEILNSNKKFTIDDMFKLQNDTHSLLAECTVGIFTNVIEHLKIPLNNVEENYLKQLKEWDKELGAESKAASIYQIWWYHFYNDKWNATLKRVPENLFPLPERTMQLLVSEYYGNNLETETLKTEKYADDDVILKSFKETMDSIQKLEKTIGIQWYMVKNTTVKHLSRLDAFSYQHLKIGGWSNTVNAAKGDHGPSWRMVVEMGKDINAYGVYPGGQSGNPGSKYYDDFLQNWVEGKYYKLQFLPNNKEQNNNSFKSCWTLHP